MLISLFNGKETLYLAFALQAVWQKISTDVSAGHFQDHRTLSEWFIVTEILEERLPKIVTSAPSNWC